MATSIDINMTYSNLFVKVLISVALQWTLQTVLVSCHHNRSFRHAEHSMRDISSRYGVMVSFEKPVYMNGMFQGFEGWDVMNAHFGANNITYIVRVEFELPSFKENRIKRRFRLYWSVA